MNRTALIPGRYIEFQANVLRQLPRPEEIDEMTLEGWNNNQKALKKALAKVLLPTSDISSLLRDWEKFYQDVFGITADFSNLKVPEKKEGYDWLIVVAQGMTPQRLYDKCKELFPSWKYTDSDLDKIIQSERTSKNGAYAVWFRNTVEADEDLKNLSKNDLKKEGVPGIAFEERLLMELKYFKETGKHLDIDNITLCSGSRFSVGDVPEVLWDSGQVFVDWCDPEHSHACLRSRRAVF